MTTTIKIRRDTAANWTSVNPILASGEPGLETDTLRLKYGDGANAWANLSYQSVANAAFATNATNANIANLVAVANVSGIGNIAVINLDGNSANALRGNGSFGPVDSVGNMISNGSNSFSIDGNGNVIFKGNVAGQGINRGLVWDYGANANGVNSQVRQDNSGLTVRAYTQEGGSGNGYSAPVNIVTNQDANTNTWTFDGQGNLTIPGNLILQSGNIVTDTFSLTFNSAITGITTGNATVIVTLASEIFEDSSVGEVTISSVTGTTQANGTWYYEAVEIDQFQLYTDANLTTPVDGTSWTTYISGGTAVSVAIYTDFTIQGGNVTISSNDNTWTFDTNGDINIPPNATSFETGRIQSANGYPTLLAYGSEPEHGGPELDWMDGDDPANGFGNSSVLRNTLYINDGGLYVGMNENNVSNTFAGGWRFTPTGTTIFPTLEVDLHNGGVQEGQVLQFGNSSQQVIITGPTPSANVNAERLIIQGQRGNSTNSEGGDVYFWAGDADLYGGDIKIYAGDADNVSAGSGGYVNIDGGAGFDIGGQVEITGGFSSNGTGGYVSIIGGGSSNGTGGYVSIIGGSSGNGLSEYGNVSISSGVSTWTFANDGNLTFPDSTIQSTAWTGITGFGDGFSLDNSDKIVTNKLYSTNETQANQHYRLELDTNGVVVLPDGSIINGSTIRGVAGTGELNYTGITIGPDSGNAEKTWMWVDHENAYIGTNNLANTWTFDNNGNLTLPEGGIVHETSIPFGGLEGNTIALKPSGGTNADQQLLIYPTAGNQDLNHLHLTSGNLFNTELFLGNDDFNVKLANTGNIVINTNDNIGNVGTWTFDTASNLTLPQLTTISDESGIGTTLTVGAPPTVIVISGADFSAVNTTYTKTSAATPTWEPASYNPVTDPYIEFSGGEYGIFAPSFGQALYVNTGTLNKPLTQWNINPPLGSVAPTAVYTYGTPGPDWIFGNDGNLTLPGNMILSGNTYLMGSDTALIKTNDDLPLVSLSTGANGSATSIWLENYDDIANSNIAAIYAPLPGTGTVRIVAGTNGANINTWDFATDGSLTISGNLVANGASPAPTLSGFSSLKAVDEIEVGANAVVLTSTGDVSATGNISAVNIGNISSTTLDGNVSNVLTGNGTFVTLPVINANTVVWTTAPGSNVATGNVGQAAYDSGGNLYVCVVANTWAKFTGTTSW